jgi:tRNA A37 threonylcarbamoyladenosine dehydratase
MSLEQLSTQLENQKRDLSYSPVILDLNKKADQKKLQSVLENKPTMVDFYSDQLKELEEVNHPELIANPHSYGGETGRNIKDGRWVYYSWKNSLVHVLDENDYYKLRTSRNLNLITEKEQKILRKKKIAFAGLNVGNPGAICCALEGVGSYYRYADFDELSLSNLNRFRSGLCELGINKATLTTRQAYEIDPYLKIDLFDKGVDPRNPDEFLVNPKVDIFIEEVDNLKLKIDIRKSAKKYNIPVVMVTGNGQNVIIDVERYDTDKSLDILSGDLKKEVIDDIYNLNPKTATLDEKIKLAMDFMGDDILHPRLVESFSQIGKKLAGIPQLSESSFLRGGAICYFVRRILLKEDVPSGRYFLDMDKLI